MDNSGPSLDKISMEPESDCDIILDMKSEMSHEKPIPNADMGSNILLDQMSDPNSGSENGKVDDFDETSPKHPDESPNVGKFVQKLETVIRVPEFYHELQDNTNTLDERTENFESGLQQSWKLSDFVIDGFMQLFGYETNNCIHSAPFDN